MSEPQTHVTDITKNADVTIPVHEKNVKGTSATEVQREPSRREKWFLKVLAGGICTDASGASMVAPFLPSLSLRFGFHQQTIALLLGIRSFTAILVAVPVGVAFRSFGHSRILTFSFILAVLASVLFAIPQSWWWVVIALILQGVCTQTVRTGSISYVARVFSRNRRKRSSVVSAYSQETMGEGEGEEEGKGKSEGAGEREEGEDEGENAEGGSEGESDEEGGEKSGGEKEEKRGVDKSTDFVQICLNQEVKAVVEGQEGRVNSSFQKKSSPFLTNMGLIYCWTSLGGVIGPVVGSVLYQFGSTWTPFAVVATCCLILAFVISCFGFSRKGGYKLAKKNENSDVRSNNSSNSVHSRPTLKTLPSIPENSHVAHYSNAQIDDVESSKRNAKKLTLLRVLHTTLGDDVGRGVMYVACVQSMAWGLYEVVLPYYLSKRCAYGTAEIGFAFGINNFVYAIVAYFAGPVVGRIGSNKSVFFGITLVAISLPVMCIPGFSCRMELQYLFNGINGLGFAFIETPLLCLLVDSLSSLGLQDDGLVVSAYQIFFTTGYAIAPLFAALLFLFFKSVGVMAGMSAVLSLGFLVLPWSVRVNH